MDYVVHSQPSYSLVEITLDPGEQLVTESGAMAWMTENMRAETSARGGIMSGLSRSVLGGESFFQNTYEAEGGQGTIGLAPGQPGDILAYEMRGRELLLERGAYLASTPGVKTNSDFQGLRGLFNEGMFILRASGTGTSVLQCLRRYPGNRRRRHVRRRQRPCGCVGTHAQLPVDSRRKDPVVPLLGPDHHGILWQGQALGPIEESPLPGRLGPPLPRHQVVPGRLVGIAGRRMPPLPKRG